MAGQSEFGDIISSQTLPQINNELLTCTSELYRIFTEYIFIPFYCYNVEVS